MSNVVRLVRDTMMGLFPSTRAAYLAGVRHGIDDARRAASDTMSWQSVRYERHADPAAFHAIEETQGKVREKLTALYEIARREEGAAT